MSSAFMESPLHQARRRVGYGLTGLFGAFGLWLITPGIPAWWWSAPRASAETKAAGLALFNHEWTPDDPLAAEGGDGLGPVFNARSCVACHFQGGVGGGGDNEHNVTAFEAEPTRDRPEVKGGLIHKFAVSNTLLEDRARLAEFYPIVPNGLRVEGGCQVLVLDFDPVQTQSVNTTALFGAGWIDRLSGKSIWHEGMKTLTARIGRELDGKFDGIIPGRARVLPDGRVGKFGWKAQFASLDDFVAAACANEVGLGNPRMSQARPMVKLNYPEVGPDLSSEQFGHLVSFVETLPRPVEATPTDHDTRTAVDRGKVVFREVGCDACHTPEIGGLEGVYSDFLLHRLDDRSKGGYRETPPVPRPHDVPLAEEWKTPPLWGVADSAPYFHDGGSPTLVAAIERHHGDAEPVTAVYRKLPAADRDAVIAFLRTLKAPPDVAAAPMPTPASKPGGRTSRGKLVMTP